VQEQLGHTSAQTTLNVYTHILKTTNEQALNLLENLKCEHKMSIVGK
jgi:integrase